MRAHLQQTVRRSVDRVFPFLADPRNRPRWQSSLRTVEMLSEGEPRVGMRWRERPGGLFPFEMCITALEPNQLWVESLEGGAIHGRIELRFSAHDGATRIDATIHLDLPTPMRLIAPVIRAVLVAVVRRDLARVEALV